MTTKTPDNNRFLTIPQLAHELSVHRSTVSRWIDEGRIPVRRIGPRTIRILRAEVQELLAKVAED